MRPVHHPHRLNLIPAHIILQTAQELLRGTPLLRLRGVMRKRLVGSPLALAACSLWNGHFEDDVVGDRVG